MRALLVVNPKASTMSARARDVLAHALASELKLDVAETNHRNHATELAAQATADGLDLVVALGGDGTVNEVVNGLLHDGAKPGVPALGVVPAGRTNVFARALGLPNSAVEATGVLLQSLLEDRRRRIGLGRADGRWFTFNAGLGVDAGAVQRVEAARHKGRTATQARYVKAALAEFYFGSQRRAELTLTRPGEEPLELALALVCNTDPWTFLGNRPVRPCPDASFDTGLDVLGLRRTSTLPTLRTVSQILAKDGHPRGKQVVSLHDLPELDLTATTPLPFQVDGDLVDERDRLHLVSVPDALDVLV
jgi:diacylglycerol kinase family enzyme